MFIKLSFRQLLLGVFLLIALLLSATSIQALFTLDRLAAESREVGQDAVILTANVQRLAERSVAMERSARQFLVLDDPAFRDRYAAAWRDGEDALSALSAGLPPSPKPVSPPGATRASKPGAHWRHRTPNARSARKC